MTSKKRRQRGSRTHGGGTHKNRRGAGHRGGRGNAGRAKHEFHNHEPLGKSGFKRPQKVQEEVVEIDVRELDEDAAAGGRRPRRGRDGGAFVIDARDVVDDADTADVVKSARRRAGPPRAGPDRGRLLRSAREKVEGWRRRRTD